MSADHTLRPLRATDAPALVALYRRCSKETLDARRHPEPITTDAAARRFIARHDGIVAVDGGGGIRGVGVWTDHGHGWAEVAFLVDDRSQGRGIGRQLAAATFKALKKQGFTRWGADAGPGNTRVKRLVANYPHKTQRVGEFDVFHGPLETQ